MSEVQIKDEISRVLFDLGLTENSRVEDKEFKEIFELIDSLSLINFVVELENSFGVELPDEYLLPENFVSISNLAGYIQNLMNCD